MPFADRGASPTENDSLTWTAAILYFIRAMSMFWLSCMMDLPVLAAIVIMWCGVKELPKGDDTVVI